MFILNNVDSECELNNVESFLLRLEENELHVFRYCLEYEINPIIPFFQVVHLTNLQEVLNILFVIERECDGYLIRADGMLVLVTQNLYNDRFAFKQRVKKLYETMRF